MAKEPKTAAHRFYHLHITDATKIDYVINAHLERGWMYDHVRGIDRNGQKVGVLVYRDFPSTEAFEAFKTARAASGKTRAAGWAAVTKIQTGVLVEIVEERTRQDQQWGGTAHDDQHESEDWFRFIGHQIDRASAEFVAGVPDGDRQRLVKIAALAVAGLESLNRKAMARAEAGA